MSGPSGPTGPSGPSGPSGPATSDFPYELQRNVWIFYDAAGVGQMGGTTGVTTAGTVTSVNDARNCWARLTTGNVSGNNARVNTTDQPIFLDFNPIVAAWRIRTGSSVASVTIKVTLGFTQPANAAAETVDSPLVGFRFVAGTDTKWTPYTLDGTGAGKIGQVTANSAHTLDTVNASTEYYLRLRIYQTGAIFHVQFWSRTAGAAETGPTTLILGHKATVENTTGNRIGSQMDVWTNTAAAKFIDFGGLWVDTEQTT